MTAGTPEYLSVRVPPWSAEAEQYIIGGLLLDGGASWDKVGDLVVTRDFYSALHRIIFEAIGGMVNALKVVDILTVFARLQDIGKADEVGGIMYLNACSQSAPSSANIRHYAKIVKERSLQRDLISATDTAAALAWHSDIEIGERIDQVSSILINLERGQSRKAPRHISEVMIERLDRITELNEGEVKSGWTTGLGTLDGMLNGGLRGGRLYVLAARPSVGKSSLAASIALHFGKAELPALFLSQEMSSGEVVDRAISHLGEIDYGAIQTGQLNDLEWGQLSEACESGSRLALYVDDEDQLTIAKIRSKARTIKGLKLLVVDYLQMTVGTAGNNAKLAVNRNTEIEEVSRGLKGLAKELDCAVLLLSQLNRKVEERPGKRPMMSDLRDSGAIEQDADVVLFLWPIKEFKGDHFWAIGIDVQKNRQGKKGAYALHFYGRHMLWRESHFELNDLLSRDASGAAHSGGFE